MQNNTRFNMTLSPELLEMVDNMAQSMNAYRVDVVEIAVAFYFKYVGLGLYDKLNAAKKGGVQL
jgi:hypothetical protein